MEVVWQLRRATAAEVISTLSQTHDWNHRTIRTLLSRLVDKRALSAESEGAKYVYAAILTRRQCVRQESRSFLDKVFGGDAGALLTHFVKDSRVSREELEQLRRLLDEKLDQE